MPAVRMICLVLRPMRARCSRNVVLLITGATLAAAAVSALALPAQATPRASLKKELREHGLNAERVWDCHRRRHGSAVCRWRATGRLKTGLDYECEGKARFLAEKRRWKIDKCDEPMVTLLSEPEAPPTFGYNDDWDASSPQAPIPTYPLLAQSGAEVARAFLAWRSISPFGPGYQWGPAESIYISFRSIGLRPLWVLHDAPCWAAAPDDCAQTEKPPDPDHYDEFAAFAAELARRYPDSAGIEVWNEPNYGEFWGGAADPEAYGELLGQVATAVHTAAPGMPVIMAGLVPLQGTNYATMKDEEFLRRAYETGGPQLADAIAAHPYPSVPYKDDYLGKIRSILFRYRRVMSEFGDLARPLWVTEVGFSTAGEKPYTEEQQATALTKAYEQFLRINNLPVVIYHRFVDESETHSADPESGYGVVRSDGTPKPAYCAIAAARGRPC